MIVLIEMMVDKYREKVERWEKNRDDYMNESSYRYLSQYKREHPHPSEIYKNVARGSILLILGFAITFWLTWVISTSGERDKKEYAIASQGKNCQAHNLNDRVKIEYGAYAGKTGVIVGGCEKGKDYQVKFDAGQKFDYPSDGQNEVDLREDTIGVDSYKNLIKIGEKKDESK